MDPKKDALLDSMKPILPQTISAVRLLERCIADVEKGTLQSEIAVDTARLLVVLHQQIVAAVDAVSLDKDKSPDSQAILDFINGEFKKNILLLGEALKMALQSNDSSGLSQHTQDFRNHPRTLINMIRNASFSSDVKDNKKTSQVPTAGKKSAKKPIARSLSDGKLSKGKEDADDLLEEFRQEAKIRKEGGTPALAKEESKEIFKKPKEGETPPTATLEKKSSRKKSSKTKKRDDSRREEIGKSKLDEKSRDSRGEIESIKKKSSDTDKKKSVKVSSNDTKDDNLEKSKKNRNNKTSSSTSSKRKSQGSENPIEKLEKTSTEKTSNDKISSSKKSSSKISAETKARRPKPKESEHDRREKRKSMPTPAKLDLEDLDNTKRRRTKLVDISSFIGFDTDPGKRYGKVNQDAYLYSSSGKHGHITAVFDGHGVNGEIAAQTAKEIFEEYFKKHDLFGTKSKEKQREMIKEVFQIAHDAIIKKYEELTTIKWEGHKFNLVQIKDLMMYHNRKYGVLLQDFGTTAVMAAIKAQPIGEGALEVIIANAGDSIAFIGREEGDTLVPVEGLCTVHNGNNVVEEDRILSLGSVKKEGHYVSPPEESGFGWAQLAVTRSLGHKYFSKYGIIPDPDISDYTLNENDRFLIVTSDGVTDVFSLEEVLESLEEFYHACGGNLQKTTTKLVKHSVGMWKKRFVDARGKGEAADNTTAMVIDLKKIICH